LRPAPHHRLAGFVGNPSYRFNSPADTYHVACDAQNMFCPGRIPGSLSNVPAGTIVVLPIFAAHGRDEPHFLQNDVA